MLSRVKDATRFESRAGSDLNRQEDKNIDRSVERRQRRGEEEDDEGD